MGRTREKELARAANVRGGACRLAAGRSNHVEYPSPPGFEASAASRAILLRLAATSAGRCVVELERTARQVFSNDRSRPEPLRLVRRQLWSRGCNDQLQRSGYRA